MRNIYLFFLFGLVEVIEELLIDLIFLFVSFLFFSFLNKVKYSYWFNFNCFLENKVVKRKRRE